MSRELAGVAIITAGVIARRAARAAAAIALLAVLLVLFVWASALAGRTAPASTCWQQPNAAAVQACFADQTTP